MAYTRRNTSSDATWARAWTADNLSDLVTISAILGSERPHHGDIAFVTATGFYYLWMDDGSWTQITGLSSVAGSTPIFLRQVVEDQRRLILQQIFNQNNQVIPDTSTGAVTNWTPALNGNTIIEWSGASDATFQGLSKGFVGQIVTVKNKGTKNAFFAHNSGTTSLAVFKNLITSGVTPIAPNGYISFYFDGTAWQLIDHKQGAAIAIAFDATKFTASGSMTWTVGSGDVVTNTYIIDGTIIEWVLRLQQTTVGGTPDTELRATMPNGYTAVGSSFWNELGAGDNTSAFVIATCGPVASQVYVRMFKDLGSGANWSASTDNTYVNFSIRVQLN